MKLVIRASLVLVMALTVHGCTVKFQTTPANTETPAESIAITTFNNMSGGGPPSLSQDLSEAIRTYFMNNTKLEIVNDPSEGDLVLEGDIVGFQVAPAAASSQDGQERAPLNRLTITLSVTYENPYTKDYSFKDKRISYFADFDANESLTQVEDQLSREIIEELVVLVFNASFDNW